MGCACVQLHLHVGILVSGVKKGLEAGHTWAKKNNTNAFLIACGKAKNTDITCRFDDKKQKLSENTITVTIARGTEPKDVKPFETVRMCTWEHFCCSSTLLLPSAVVAAVAVTLADRAATDCEHGA
jgi:hypothetical protein